MSKDNKKSTLLSSDSLRASASCKAMDDTNTPSAVLNNVTLNVSGTAKHFQTSVVNNTSNPFETFILPISGADFPKLMAYYSIFADYGIKPKLIYCASGGCLTSYMAMMSSFTKSIENWKVNSDMFIEKATPITPRMMTYILNGHFYRRADIYPYVKDLFIPCKIQDVEIITGHYRLSDDSDNQTDDQAIVISTNQPKSKSVLKDFKPNLNCIEVSFSPEPTGTTQSEKEAYWDLVMKRAVDSIKYTTNIPILLEPLDNVSALDFGIVAPNPQSIVNKEVKKSIYFCPVNLDKCDCNNTYGIVFRNYILKDIISICHKFNNHENFKSVDEVLQTINSSQLTDYCLVIYSTNVITMSIDKFDDRATKHFMEASKKSVKFRLSY